MEGHKYFKGVPQSRAELQILVLLSYTDSPIYASLCPCNCVHVWLSVYVLFVCVSGCFVEVVFIIHCLQPTELCFIFTQ